MSNLIQIERVGVDLKDLQNLIDYWDRVSDEPGFQNDVGVGLKMASTQLRAIVKAHREVKK